MPATSLTAMTSWRKSVRRKRTFDPGGDALFNAFSSCCEVQCTGRGGCGLQADPGTLSAQQLKMDVMRADERKIFATTKAKSEFSNVYSCHHWLDDIMRATDVVFGGKSAFCERFLRWSRRFLWLRHRHPSFVLSCSFTNHGRLLVDGPWVVCMRMALGRLLADGPWSSTDGPWFPKRVVYGWLVVVYGRPVVVYGWPIGSQNRSSTDGPWSSTDGADGPWFPKLVVYGWPEVVCGWPEVVYGWPEVVKQVRQQFGGLSLGQQ